MHSSGGTYRLIHLLPVIEDSQLRAIYHTVWLNQVWRIFSAPGSPRAVIKGGQSMCPMESHRYKELIEAANPLRYRPALLYCMSSKNQAHATAL